MPREDWRDRDEMRWRRMRDDPRDREDFGQADYSRDYGYDPRHRTGYRMADEVRPRTEDYGQADYTSDWAYDPERGRPYRRFSDEDRGYRDDGRREDHPESRSWLDRAGDFLSGRPRDEDDEDDRRRYDDRYEGRGRYERRRLDERRYEPDRERGYEADRERRRRRDGPSDRVLWAVITERLDHERRLDLRDVEVVVEDGEVILNGTVRRKADKRRIEDIADVDGVRNVQNNLRVRDVDRRWTLI